MQARRCAARIISRPRSRSAASAPTNPRPAWNSIESLSPATRRFARLELDQDLDARDDSRDGEGNCRARSVIQRVRAGAAVHFGGAEEFNEVIAAGIEQQRIVVGA